jgi:hypothetical protein
MKKHRAKKHPVEWEDEQEVYRRDNPFVCKFKKCLKQVWDQGGEGQTRN